MAEAPQPLPIETVPTREGYDRWADIYDDEDNPLIAIEEPNFKRLLGDVAHLDAIDVGCGTGRHSLALASAGASVTAIDFSSGMVAKAARKPGWERVRFVEHDLSEPLPFDDETFDRVVCGLVLDHIHEPGHLFREFARICRRDGRVLISVMHPAMMLRGVQARFTDAACACKVQPASAPNQISDYVRAALAAALHIDHISEHIVDDDVAARCPRAKKYLGWPLLLMMRMHP